MILKNVFVEEMFVATENCMTWPTRGVCVINMENEWQCPPSVAVVTCAWCSLPLRRMTSKLSSSAVKQLQPVV